MKICTVNICDVCGEQYHVPADKVSTTVEVIIGPYSGDTIKLEVCSACRKRISEELRDKVKANTTCKEANAMLFGKALKEILEKE